MAPWTHTYLSPQSERRLCCASRETAQNFRQYIDSGDNQNQSYQPLSLEDWWNSEHVRRIRRQMMAGEIPPECVVCDKKLLNTDVYRDYFWHLFNHKYEDIWKTTSECGATSMLPVSWDYRFGNICNFKCRMCGPMLSSAWESEAKQHGNIEDWMQPEVKKKIDEFQQDVAEEEFRLAVEEHLVEEVYWVGGEPLLYPQHWKYMRRIIELGDGMNVYARYNTNLSRTSYKNIHLFRDILAHIRDWQICASLDGTGAIGEYIRTGLDYQQWLANFKEGITYSSHPRQMRIDFTLTLPGLFGVKDIVKLANELNVGLLSKVCFAFDSSIAMSPLFLPKNILHPILDDLIDFCQNYPGNQHRSMLDILINLKNRPVFGEQYSNEYKHGQIKGKQRIMNLERIRTSEILTMEDILSENSDTVNWWRGIPNVIT